MKVKRTVKAVRDNFEMIEGKMRECIRWAECTGQGVLEEDEINGLKTVEAVLKRKFPYYYELIPVFSERAGMKPKIVRQGGVEETPKKVSN